MQCGASSIAAAEAQAKDLTIDQLAEQIEILVRRYQNASRPQQRRHAIRLLVWLERCRERLHGIRAPRRTFLGGDIPLDAKS